MKQSRRLAVFFTGALTASVISCAVIVYGAAAPKDKASVDAGKKIFTQYCATCHGTKGLGDGAGARGLVPPPRNFATGKFKFGSDDASLFKTVSNGSPGTAMPAWKTSLSDKQRWQVIAYVKTLMKSKAKPKK